jgi:hypothetical protein
MLGDRGADVVIAEPVIYVLKNLEGVQQQVLDDFAAQEECQVNED